MAPVPVAINDLAYSSLELDSRSFKPFDLADYLSSLSIKEREALTHTPDAYSQYSKRDQDDLSVLSPSETFNLLTARDAAPTQSYNPSVGAVDPNSVNMKGIQALFAIIGVVFVVGALWFFFWAKNGGFQWRKGDWEEYKSTVLRRKGPNGTTLSNATKSTRLGGGSVVGQGYSDVDASTVTGTMTELSSEAPIIKEKASNKPRGKKETAKDRKIREAKQAAWEGGHDNDVRAYRHEKVARVGGLNKESDAQYYGTDYTETERSDVSSNTHSNRPPRQSPRTRSPEKRQTRRDFSYGDEAGFTAQQSASRPARYHSPSKNDARSSRQNVPGGFTSPLDFSDVQSQHTKTYHHPLPNLPKGSGGYRRDRRDSLDD